MSFITDKSPITIDIFLFIADKIFVTDITGLITDKLVSSLINSRSLLIYSYLWLIKFKLLI
jgi:hypothetical protein